MNNREYETIEEIISDNYTRGYDDGVNQGLKGGKLRTSEILDKISAEIKENILDVDVCKLEKEGLYTALDIIEKYKGDNV